MTSELDAEYLPAKTFAVADKIYGDRPVHANVTLMQARMMAGALNATWTGDRYVVVDADGERVT